MIPLHSLLTMTPASSPADEKPPPDAFDDVPPQPPVAPQPYNQPTPPQQYNQPTPPQDLAPQNQNHPAPPAFNNPFEQAHHHQLHTAAVPHHANQHGGIPLPHAPQPHGASYSFNRSYQNGEPGYFAAAAPRTDSLGSNHGSGGSAPGTPGPGRVAIPRRGTGPMSADVTVPPRPKPGRKPIEADNQHDRRRTQNRLAQRNFRDRRQQKLSELHEQIEQQRADRQADHARFHNELSQLEQQNKELRAELEAVRGENASLREQLCQAVQARSTGNFRRDTTGDAAMSGLAAPVPATNRRTGPSNVNRGTSPVVASGSGTSNGSASGSASADANASTTASANASATDNATDNANTNATDNAPSTTDAIASPLETDFTYLSRPRQAGSFRQNVAYIAAGPPQSPSTATSSPSATAPARASSPPTVEAAHTLLGIEGKIYDCGFCTDPVVCVCRLNDHYASQALVGMSKSPPQGKGRELRELSEGEEMEE